MFIIKVLKDKDYFHLLQETAIFTGIKIIKRNKTNKHMGLKTVGIVEVKGRIEIRATR